MRLDSGRLLTRIRWIEPAGVDGIGVCARNAGIVRYSRLLSKCGVGVEAVGVLTLALALALALTLAGVRLRSTSGQRLDALMASRERGTELGLS